MSDYNVDLVFNDGVNTYTFPLVQTISDPIEGIKATIIEGNRADGAIVIPGGKKSQEIRITGILFDNDGYADLTSLMADMRSKVTTSIATLTLKHYASGWITDWAYTVRRIDTIEFDENSMRTSNIKYTVTFLVLSY